MSEVYRATVDAKINGRRCQVKLVLEPLANNEIAGVIGLPEHHDEPLVGLVMTSTQDRVPRPALRRRRGAGRGSSTRRSWTCAAPWPARGRDAAAECRGDHAAAVDAAAGGVTSAHAALMGPPSWRQTYTGSGSAAFHSLQSYPKGLL